MEKNNEYEHDADMIFISFLGVLLYSDEYFIIAFKIPPPESKVIIVKSVMKLPSFPRPSAPK